MSIRQRPMDEEKQRRSYPWQEQEWVAAVEGSVEEAEEAGARAAEEVAASAAGLPATAPSPRRPEARHPAVHPGAGKTPPASHPGPPAPAAASAVHRRPGAPLHPRHHYRRPTGRRCPTTTIGLTTATHAGSTTEAPCPIMAALSPASSSCAPFISWPCPSSLPFSRAYPRPAAR